jgi:hypothetical protein
MLPVIYLPTLPPLVLFPLSPFLFNMLSKTSEKARLTCARCSSCAYRERLLLELDLIYRFGFQECFINVRSEYSATSPAMFAYMTMTYSHDALTVFWLAYTCAEAPCLQNTCQVMTYCAICPLPRHPHPYICIHIHIHMYASSHIHL